MNSYQRVFAAVRHARVDCVPVAPYMGNHGAKIGGAIISKYCTDGQIMAQAQLNAWKIYGQDMLVAQSDNYYIAEGFGVRTKIPEDSTPFVLEYPVKKLEDIYKLKVPDPFTDGRMPVYIEAVQLLKSRVGNQAVVRCPGTGCFSLAGHLMGTENFLMGLFEAENDPDGETAKALRHLLEATSDALISFAKAIIGEGGDIATVGDSLASIDMISPNMYRNWAWPYERKVFSALDDYKRKKNFATLLHICGNMTPVLSEMAETGADIIELDYKVSLETAKQCIGESVCLIGNLDPASILLNGTPELVAEESQKCIDAAGKGRGFILGSGCELALYTPVENVKAMIATARNNSFH